MTGAHRRWQRLAWLLVTLAVAAVLVLSWPQRSPSHINAPWPAGLAPADYGSTR